jgi:hypothetical protein
MANNRIIQCENIFHLNPARHHLALFKSNDLFVSIFHGWIWRLFKVEKL